MSTPNFAPAELHAIAAVANFANNELRKVYEPDYRIRPWASLSFTERSSLLVAVLQVMSGQIATPEDAHAAWVADKVAQGWVKGPFNAEDKTHPCIVNWNELTPQERARDVAFIEVTQAMVRAIHAARNEV